MTLPNHILIIVNKPLSKLATLLILKLSPSSSGFDEFSQTGPFQKLIKPRKCKLITLIYAKKYFVESVFSYLSARHFINPKVHYDDIKWMKKQNSRIWQKRRRKLESDSRPRLKIKTLHQKVQDSDNKRNTITKLWDRLQTLWNRHKKTSLIPLIKPTRESVRKLPASSKTFAMCLLSLLINKDVHADHSGNIH